MALIFSNKNHGLHKELFISPRHYLMGSTLSDSGPDLTVLWTNFTEKSKKMVLKVENCFFREDCKTINKTKTAIKQVCAYKRLSQIKVMK